MPRANEQKIKLLVLYDILQRETDEEHPLSTNEIIERLSARGIEVSRKILPGDIALLNKYGFEILSYKKKSHYYYVAYRPFDIAELKVFIDAVQAATFISESKTEGLVNRLASMAGEKQAEKLKQNFICYDTVKKDSKYIFYYIDEIERAIEQGNKISFCYCYLTYKAERKYRKDGQRYIVNPLALVYSRENYYVVCYDNNHKGCANYRIDRMPIRGAKLHIRNMRCRACHKKFAPQKNASSRLKRSRRARKRNMTRMVLVLMSLRIKRLPGCRLSIRTAVALIMKHISVCAKTALCFPVQMVLFKGNSTKIHAMW